MDGAAAVALFVCAEPHCYSYCVLLNCFWMMFRYQSGAEATLRLDFNPFGGCNSCVVAGGGEWGVVGSGAGAGQWG